MAYGSMLDQGSGKVINLVSQPIGGILLANAAYCASTFGFVGLTKVLASEWAGRGITANRTSPTVLLAELGRKAWPGVTWSIADPFTPQS
jgi:NAD(P)-dependent dehydrogenase (short-subunit alcohol dehydrogenase family)